MTHILNLEYFNYVHGQNNEDNCWNKNKCTQ